LLALTACFEKESKIPLKEFDGSAFVFNESIYSKQFFYDLGTNSIKSQNDSNKWDISFDCATDGWTIRINSSNLLGVLKTGITDFNTTIFSNFDKKWEFDTSNGKIDSTAIGNWVNISSIPYTYSQEVYLIGQYNGYKYNPLKKLLFYAVTDTSYNFKYADINGENMHDTIILKDSFYNQVYYSLIRNKIEKIEPPKKEWDLLFTTYSTILYTDTGEPTPYFVRGILINPYKVTVALDTVNNFYEINKTLFNDYQFINEWDIIGYNWKSVKVDQQSNTAVYAVRPNYSYIIKDTDNDFYKLKFISFFNYQNSPGYPSFILTKLEIINI